MTIEILPAASLDTSAADAIVEFVHDDITCVSPHSLVDIEALRRLGFKGKLGETLRLSTDDRLIIAVGLGAKADADRNTYRRAAGVAARAAKSFARVILLQPLESQAVAEGIVLGSYSFTQHKSTSTSEQRLQTVHVVGADATALSAGARIAEATNLARDLINEPPSSMTPRVVARVASDVAHQHGLAIDVWEDERIADERLGGILGVSSGSDEPPRLIKLTYEPDGANENTKTIAIAGKGITFDSGGLSLKPSDSMVEMKTDMSGAATTFAAMSTLAHFRPNVRVVGFLACSENLPGPSATKPGDVLTARNGKTMEVLNTDAEGRLVLADALSLAVEEQPDAIIDIATLTGACKMALGNDIAGVFATDDALFTRVQDASQRTGENVWRMPLHSKYAKLIESNVADIKNMASPGGGGLITSAFFLKEFVGDVPWVHFDIAGTARGDGDDALSTKGATGYGVRILVDIVRNYG
jgi:leucyl aminopeptidase